MTKLVKCLAVSCTLFLSALGVRADQLSVTMTNVTFVAPDTGATEVINGSFLLQTDCPIAVGCITPQSLTSAGAFTGLQFDQGGVISWGQGLQSSFIPLTDASGTEIDFSFLSPSPGSFFPLGTFSAFSQEYFLRFFYCGEAACGDFGGVSTTGTITVASVSTPEPSIPLLLGAGFFALFSLRRLTLQK